MTNFELNEDCSVTVEAIGHERHPVIIIDGFLKNPAMLIDIAADCDFTPVEEAGNFYPGIRARAPQEYAACVYRSTSTLIGDVFGISNGVRAKVSLCAFSLATMKPHELNAIQCLPHFDTSNSNQFAALHYLFSGDLGGTSFYRHRDTGYEAITSDRTGQYVDSIKKSTGADAAQPTGYVNGDTDLFERIADIEAKTNRLIIYKSFLLHSGSIGSDQNFTENPREGRLTANTFLEIG